MANGLKAKTHSLCGLQKTKKSLSLQIALVSPSYFIHLELFSHQVPKSLKGMMKFPKQGALSSFPSEQCKIFSTIKAPASSIHRFLMTKTPYSQSLHIFESIQKIHILVPPPPCFLKFVHWAQIWACMQRGLGFP
jgi:hypothetical protein